ncbi:MAG TPA: bifunctional 5,10-methylenetetrahydrofolate dehydrogenase/5,10-methenyltetrahydrofolate cyclohydrolase [Pyrinomonadaceae bacterium]|nr:bifunctional 5,10-methylenetetrahydrofolate dehydrogenase/5,10-methenyltetrahydrofolate cyclohydrolase [Pyrinomonadaceae bacterium]
MQTRTAESEKHSARRLGGDRAAEAIRAEVREEVERLAREHGVVPCLAAVRVGNDPASEVYVRNKVRACAELGLRSEHHALSEETTADGLLSLVGELNGRDDVDGILVQLPLPRQIDSSRVIEAVHPLKDVDGFHPVNVGLMTQGSARALVPCTPAGIVELLAREGVEVKGAEVCVVGRSNIVGRPVAELLLRRDATVTVCHSRTRDLAAVTRRADILVAAIGRPGFIRGEHVREGATVIDVGINRVTDEAEVRELFGDAAGKRLEGVAARGYTIVGDAHPAEVGRVAGLLTPVPGGVGLLTIVMLMKNTVRAAKLRRGIG